MSKPKPITPYARLLDAIRVWCSSVTYRHTVEMWFYPKDRLHEGWSMKHLAERVQAAEQLGYDVQLVWNNDVGLQVFYKKKIPTVPYEWK